MRIALKVAGAFVALCVIGAIALAIAIATIDTRALIGPIQNQVRQATGRELAIGAIDIKLALLPTIVVSDVAIGNASWAKAPHLATAKRVEVQIALLPLLQRRYEVTRLVLGEPVIALESNARKQGNWQFERVAPARAPAPASTPGDAWSAAGAFGVADFAVTGGVLTYDDADGKVTTIAIDNLDVRVHDA